MGHPGVGMPIVPNNAKYNGKELTFEGIPTSGDEFITWKILMESDVVRAANYSKPAVAQQYVEVALNPRATEAELRDVPEEMLQLDQLVSSQIMKGMKTLIDSVRAGSVDGSNASFLMTKLQKLQTSSSSGSAAKPVGR